MDCFYKKAIIDLERPNMLRKKASDRIRILLYMVAAICAWFLWQGTRRPFDPNINYSHARWVAPVQVCGITVKKPMVKMQFIGRGPWRVVAIEYRWAFEIEEWPRPGWLR